MCVHHIVIQFLRVKINFIINKKTIIKKKEMKEMNKKNYMSPMVEILNARVEKGFQTSSGSTPVDPHSNVPGGIEVWDPNTQGGTSGSEVVDPNMFD